MTDTSTSHTPGAGRQLDAGMAVVAALLYLAGQVAGTVLAMGFAMFRHAQAGGDLSDPALTDTIMAESGGVLAIAAMLGGVAAVAVAAYLVRPSLTDRGPSGAAWVWGSARAWGTSLLMGAALSSLVFVAAELVPPPESGGELSQLADQPGFGRAAWIVVAVVLAPPLEEFLFRGLMLGGLHRRLGLRWAVAITTVVFVSLHVTEAIHYWPAWGFLLALSLLATRQRLVHRAIGPAVAAHLGYNGVIAISVVFAS